MNLTEQEKQQSIEYIMQQFKKQQNKRKLFAPFKEIPINVIFHSSPWVKILSLLSVVVYVLILLYIDKFFRAPDMDGFIFVVVMFFSPILFFIHLIDISRSFSHQVYELEMTLKYRYHQLIGYKFIVLTLLSLMMNFIVILSFPFLSVVDSTITVLSSLFISTSFIYFIVFKFKTPLMPMFLIILWTMAHGGLILYMHHLGLNALFQHYKLLIYSIGVILAVILHVVQFKYIYKKQSERGVNYA